MQYVIIGNGPAGVVAAETLRKEDPAGQILLIGDEPEPPYSRMAIPYFLTGKIAESGTHLRKDPAHFTGLGIQQQVGRVAAVNPGKSEITLQGGGAVGYDRLLIATGASPADAPIPGIDLPGVHACWTLEDGRNIAQRAKPGTKVVLMGAGFVGCIILEALAKNKVDLTLVASGNRLVPRMMTEKAGKLLLKWCEQRGVKVHTQSRAQAIEQVNAPEGALLVTLNNGQKLHADLVIKATGVRSNVGFLAGSGIDIDRGIRVDECMESSVAGIFAAGDVAQSRDFSTGNMEVHAIQPTAVEQGRIAALNMAGKRATYQGSLSMNVLDTMGLVSSSYGLWMGVEGGESVEVVDEERFKYLSLQFKDDVLVGATSLGLTQHVGVLRGLIQGKYRLGEWRERLKEDPFQLMAAYLACAQPASVAAR